MRAIAFALLLAGCHNVYLSDDEGAQHPSPGIGEHPDELSQPYALGTQVQLSVHNAAAGFQLVSDAPSVFAIDPQGLHSDGVLTAAGRALAEGTAQIRVIDGSGNERRTALVTIHAADRARLFSHGDLRVLGNDSSASYDATEVTDARVLTGGKAVFAVAYYHGAERVYGRGLASAQPAAPFLAENVTSSGAPTNEWLEITGGQPGSYMLFVMHGQTALANLPLTVVAESDLAGLSLSQESTSKKHEGDETWVYARATTGDGHQVLGVYADWSLDGAAQATKDKMGTKGDLYRFKLGPQLRALTATRGALTATSMIQASDGYVADTTYLGCSTVPGRPARAPLFAMLLLVATAGWRARRRSTPR